MNPQEYSHGSRISLWSQSSEMSQHLRLKLTHDSEEVQGNDCSTIQAV